MLRPRGNESNFLGSQEWVKILIITLVLSPNHHLHKDMQHVYLLILLFSNYLNHKNVFYSEGEIDAEMARRGLPVNQKRPHAYGTTMDGK